MKGLQLLLCGSALALSSGAWAQAQGGSTPAIEDTRLSRFRAFDQAAVAAEASAAAKEKMAEETRLFLADITDAQGRPLNQDSKLTAAVVDLSKRLKQEQETAEAARAEATSLREKANSAGHALAALGVTMFAPPSPQTPQTNSSPAPATVAPVPAQPRPDGAFGRTYANLFEFPNEILQMPTSLSGTSTPNSDESQSAPQDVAKRSANTVAASIGAFLFDRPIDRRTSGLSLSLSNQDSRLGLQFAFPWAGKFICRDNDEANKHDEEKRCDSTGSIVRDAPYLNTINFGFSASSKDGFGQIFQGGDDGGFADKLTATLGISRTIFRKRNSAQMMHSVRAAEAKLEAQCRKDLWASTPGTALEALATGCSGEALRGWALDKKTEDGVTSFVRPDSRKTLLDAIWGQENPVWDTGASIELGYRSFSFKRLSSTHPDDLDPKDTVFGRKLHRPDEFEWQVNAHFGKFFYRRDSARTDPRAPDYSLGRPVFYASFLSETGQEWTYAEGTEDQTVCPSVAAGTAFTRCSKLNIAAPDMDWFWRLGLQARFSFRGGRLIPALGLSPKVSYEVTDGQLAYDLPISFLQGSEGLNAGIRLKGEFLGDDPDDFSVGFFLATPFSILK